MVGTRECNICGHYGPVGEAPDRRGGDVEGVRPGHDIVEPVVSAGADAPDKRGVVRGVHEFRGKRHVHPEGGRVPRAPVAEVRAERDGLRRLEACDGRGRGEGPAGLHEPVHTERVVVERRQPRGPVGGFHPRPAGVGELRPGVPVGVAVPAGGRAPYDDPVRRGSRQRGIRGLVEIGPGERRGPDRRPLRDNAPRDASRIRPYGDRERVPRGPNVRYVQRDAGQEEA